MKAVRPAEAKLDRTSLVEASAGTGKTYTITTLFLRLVVEEGLSVRGDCRRHVHRGRHRRAPRPDPPASPRSARGVRRSVPRERRRSPRASLSRASDRDGGTPPRRRRALGARSRGHLDDPRVLPPRPPGARVRERRALRPRAHAGHVGARPRDRRGLLVEPHGADGAGPLPDGARRARISRRRAPWSTPSPAARPTSRSCPTPRRSDVEATLRPALEKAYAAARATWREHGKRVRSLLLGANKELSQAKDRIHRSERHALVRRARRALRGEDAELLAPGRRPHALAPDARGARLARRRRRPTTRSSQRPRRSTTSSRARAPISRSA